MRASAEEEVINLCIGRHLSEGTNKAANQKYKLQRFTKNVTCKPLLCITIWVIGV